MVRENSGQQTKGRKDDEKEGGGGADQRYGGNGAATAEACEVKHLKWRYMDVVKSIHMQGVTTCARGEIHLQLYDGERFIGVTRAYIEGSIFQDYIRVDRKPAKVRIEYTVSR